jgi:hypothetical protein
MIRHLLSHLLPVIKLAFRDNFGETLQIKIGGFSASLMELECQPGDDTTLP